MIPYCLFWVIMALIGLVVYQDFRILYLKNQLKDKDEKLDVVARLFTQVALHQQEAYNHHIAAMQAHIQQHRDEIANLRLMLVMQRSDARECRALPGTYHASDCLRDTGGTPMPAAPCPARITRPTVSETRESRESLEDPWF